jgi:hypothetical protein
MSRRGGSALALSLVSWATRPRLLWYSAPPSVHRSRKSNGRTRCELTRGHSSLLPVQRAISGYSPCTLSSGVDSLSTLRWSPTHPTHPTHLDCRVMRLLDHVRPAVHGMFDDRRIRLGILLPRFPSQRVMPRLPHARRPRNPRPYSPTPTASPLHSVVANSTLNSSSPTSDPTGHLTLNPPSRAPGVASEILHLPVFCLGPWFSPLPVPAVTLVKFRDQLSSQYSLDYRRH